MNLSPRFASVLRRSLLCLAAGAPLAFAPALAAAGTNKDAEKAAHQAAEQARKAAEQAKKDAHQAAEQAKKDAHQAAEQAKKDAHQAAEQARKAAEQAKKDAEKAAKQAAEQAKRAAEQAKKDAEKAKKEKARAAAEAAQKAFYAADQAVHETMGTLSNDFRDSLTMFRQATDTEAVGLTDAQITAMGNAIRSQINQASRAAAAEFAQIHAQTLAVLTDLGAPPAMVERAEDQFDEWGVQMGLMTEYANKKLRAMVTSALLANDAGQ